MTIDEMIAVLQAAKAGKEIQCRHHNDQDVWYSTSGPTWTFSKYDYRVKPEPREWRVFVSKTALHVVEPTAWTEFPIIKVREVLE